MTDLSQTIIAKSDQLNSDDLMGGPITVKITKVSAGNAEQPINVHYDGDQGKPWKPCKSMRRVLVHCWGADGHKYTGRSMTLYRDPEVKFGGIAVGGIRISHMSDIKADQTMALTQSRANKKPYVVRVLKTVAPSPDPAPEAPQELLDAGTEAASKGVDSYKQWIATLDESTKSMVKHKHKDWTALAKQADADEEFPL